MRVDHARVELLIGIQQELAEIAGELVVQRGLPFQHQQHVGGGHQHERTTGDTRPTGRQQLLGRRRREHGPLRQADRAGHVALVIKVDGEHSFALASEVLRQEGRDGRLADASLLIGENECLHGSSSVG